MSLNLLPYDPRLFRSRPTSREPMGYGGTRITVAEIESLITIDQDVPRVSLLGQAFHATALCVKPSNGWPVTFRVKGKTHAYEVRLWVDRIEIRAAGISTWDKIRKVESVIWPVTTQQLREVLATILLDQ